MTEAETITGRTTDVQKARRPALLILGSGNPFAGDDRAGLIFIQRLQALEDASFPAGLPRRDGVPSSLRLSTEGLVRSFCPTE